jgi:hypothetical protein
MARFEQLQEIWQRQPRAQVSAVEIATLKSSLRAYGRRQNWINAAKAVIVAAVTLWSLLQARGSARAVEAILMVMAAAAVLLAREWQAQRAIARLDFTVASRGFVRETIERLYAQRSACRRQFAPFMAAIVVAINLVLDSKASLWLRAAYTGLPFAAFEAGLWVRRKRWEHECRPLVERLRGIEAALEERE